MNMIMKILYSFITITYQMKLKREIKSNDTEGTNTVMYHNNTTDSLEDQSFVNKYNNLIIFRKVKIA